MRTTFEGSYGGDALRVADDARLECKICWYVYDPAEGCEAWQIAPGTPFSSLPEGWSCPNCDGRKDDFMVIVED
jgi:rubredoxin